MLPILKEIVEVLFDNGFIKVLLATETFAVGINMPTKTVVFTSYRKYDDVAENMRVLKTSEYIQMAGRAGRRGKDDKGIVIYLPIHQPEDPLLVKEMMTGKRATVESQMKFDYSYILATMCSSKTIQNQTYWMNQYQQELDSLREDKENITKTLETFDDPLMSACEQRHTIQESMKYCQNAEKRKYQQELSKWDNSHMGPKWEAAKKQYSQYRLLGDKLAQKERQIETLQSALYDVETRKSFLFKYGYLENDVLTQKGLIASVVHEAHPLLMTELYIHKWIENESAHGIVKILSCFLEEPKTDEVIPVVPIIDQLRKHGQSMEKSEILKSEWTITDYWYEVVGDWLEGNNFVCEKYGIEHGNFVRAILKLANVVREWVSIATLQQDTTMIEKLIGIEQVLVRGFVIPDSLYLRI
jgi:superfamily II RNA helicase